MQAGMQVRRLAGGHNKESQLLLTGRGIHLVCIHELHREAAGRQVVEAEAGVALQQHVGIGMVHSVVHLQTVAGQAWQGRGGRVLLSSR
jgi:hypothetical protein